MDKSSQKIDSLKCLVKNETEFIKKVIENSYFFTIDSVRSRQAKLFDMIAQKEPIPARKTTRQEDNPKYWHSKEKEKTYYCEREKEPIPIIIDHDGNKAVRGLIKESTHYTIGAGKDSDFQNYIISHVWGRAFDPRYFTSLWNIVIIPTWANFLMDKHSPESGSMASKLQATFKAICKQLYFQDKNEYLKLGQDIVNVLDSLPLKEIEEGEYLINVLGENEKQKISVSTLHIHQQMH